MALLSGRNRRKLCVLATKAPPHTARLTEVLELVVWMGSDFSPFC